MFVAGVCGVTASVTALVRCVGVGVSRVGYEVIEIQGLTISSALHLAAVGKSDVGAVGCISYGAASRPEGCDR